MLEDRTTPQNLIQPSLLLTPSVRGHGRAQPPGAVGLSADFRSGKEAQQRTASPALGSAWHTAGTCWAGNCAEDGAPYKCGVPSPKRSVDRILLVILL